MKSATCFKPTSDDWCPNFPGADLAGNVRVSFIKEKKSNPSLDRVVVSGDDDMMMAFDGIEAEQKYRQLIALSDVTQKASKAIGLNFE